MEVENLRAVGLRNKMAAMHEVWLLGQTAKLNGSPQQTHILRCLKPFPPMLQSGTHCALLLNLQERRQKQQELHQLLKEKQQELDRYEPWPVLQRHTAFSSGHMRCRLECCNTQRVIAACCCPGQVSNSRIRACWCACTCQGCGFAPCSWH